MTLFTQFDLDTGLHEIMCRSHGFTAPGGPRLFRAPPHPEVQWAHPTAEGAEADIRKLRAYFAALPEKKQSKTELRRVRA